MGSPRGSPFGKAGGYVRSTGTLVFLAAMLGFTDGKTIWVIQKKDHGQR